MKKPDLKLQATRLQDHGPMLMAGLRRHHAFANASRDLPLQWGEFVRHFPIPNAKGDITYGVMCGSSQAEQTFEYMSAVEVSSFEGLPDSLGRMRIPAAHYAVFAHSGHASAISRTWGAIWSEWLPGSGYKAAGSPDFERYDERFDPATGSGVVEIWFPIERVA